MLNGHSTITCPHCGRDSYLSIMQIPGRCAQCGAIIRTVKCA